MSPIGSVPMVVVFELLLHLTKPCCAYITIRVLVVICHDRHLSFTRVNCRFTTHVDDRNSVASFLMQLTISLMFQ